MAGHLGAFRAAKLKEGEEVILAVPCWVRGYSNPGELILTDQRVCFYRTGFFYGEDFCAAPHSSITGVQMVLNLLNRKIVVSTDQDRIVFKFPYGVELKTVAEKIDEARQGAARPAKAAANLEPVSALASLEELARLGILSAEEFEAKKSEVLARL